MRDNNKICGIIPPMLTPLKDRHHLDYEGTEKLINHILSAEVSGIFIFGTTGEVASFNLVIKKEFIKEVCKLVNQRVPVFVGIADTSIDNSVLLSNFAYDQGAHAIVLTSPYHYSLSQKDLLQYTRDIIPQIPLPILLYNISDSTKASYEFDTIRQLCDNEKIIGFKDSSGDLDFFKKTLKLKEERPDWAFLMGPDELLVEALQSGADGGVSGGANILPKLFGDLYAAFINGQEEKVEELDSKVKQLSDIVTSCGSYIACFKYILSCMNICSSYAAEPIHPIDKQAEEKIQKYLRESGII